jgi:hypothetical protein
MKNLKNFKEKNDLNNITLKKMDEINVFTFLNLNEIITTCI